MQRPARIAPALLLAALAAPAAGQDPPGPAPGAVVTPKAVISVKSDTRKVGSLVVLRSEGSVGLAFDWELLTDADDEIDADDDGSRCHFASGTAGKYRFRLLAFGSVVNGRLLKDVAEKTITLEGPAPGPLPVTPVTPVTPVVPLPTPAPTPPPSPGFAGHLHAVLLSQVDEPSTARLRASPVKVDLKALDCRWWSFNSTTAEFPSYGPRLRADGLLDASGNLPAPVVYLLDDASVVRGLVRSPTTGAEVVDAVKAIRGGR